MRATIVASVALLASCAEVSRLPAGADVGTQPTIAEPVHRWIPTLQVAPAIGWPAGGKPRTAAGLQVQAFAEGLEHPRSLLVLPNGDVLVAETNAPERPEEGKSIKGFFMKLFMKVAGAGEKSADRITLLRDANGDGVAETRSTFLENLHSPFGMALVGETLYVANTDGIVKFPYRRGETHIAAPGVKVAELPGGPLNHHWTKSLAADPAGRYLYAGVGSNSNVAEHGMAVEEGRAAVWQVEIGTGKSRVFATGLRNPSGLAFEPRSGALWAVANERDELGSDLVPDPFTTVKEGAFYGWPYSYFGAHVDDRVKPPRPDLVARAVVPDYALGSHVAPLGLAFSQRLSWPTPFGDGAFIGQHGSWNRRPPNGYNVVFIPFEDGRPAGRPVEVLGGFLSADSKAYGRPVGVALDARNGLLVADDVGKTVWRVTPAR